MISSFILNFFFFINIFYFILLVFFSLFKRFITIRGIFFSFIITLFMLLCCLVYLFDSMFLYDQMFSLEFLFVEQTYLLPEMGFSFYLDSLSFCFILLVITIGFFTNIYILNYFKYEANEDSFFLLLN